LQLKEHLMKQKMMRKVLISLLPPLIFSCWLFGLRVLVLLIIVNFFAVLTEYIVARSIDGGKGKVSEAVFVTGTLFTLTLPPAVPYQTAVIGIVFGVLFGKMVFGGFGRNIFNPALVGRCFIYISFPAFMTKGWIEPFKEFPGGFVRYRNHVDAIASATPIASGDASYADLFLGRISGSLGETASVLILISAVYLVVTKTASLKIIVSSASGFLILSSLLYITDVSDMHPLYSIMAGGVLFAVVFMATDPISAPKQEIAKIIYGFMIGTLAVVIRNFSVFTEGVMFAILISNVFVSLVDMKVKGFKERKKVSV
jgi:Na+-transporting NADH:ubiquinone oxidoreductase subunit B